MPRKSNRATVIQHLQRQKVIETYEPEAYRIATTNTLLQQSELEPDDGSDDFEDFDEDMEVFAPVEAVDIDIPPWWKSSDTTSSSTSTETDLILAYIESIRYLDSRRKDYSKNTTIAEWFAQPMLQEPRTFRLFLRMTRTSFDHLLTKIENHPVFLNESTCPQTPVRYQLATFLHYLGAGNCSHGQLALPLGLGEGTITLFCRRVLTAILSMKSTFIRWPSERERRTTAARICNASNGIFANCVGFVDGTYIILRYAPLTDWYYYFNRKSSYGLNAMVVCDDRRRILYTRAGETSAVHDARVFENSRIGGAPHEFFSDKEYLLGDSAYTCNDFMITPFKKPRARNQNERRFNATLSSRRIAVEHVFGILKARFPAVTRIGVRITGTETHKLVVDWFEAACILHNFLLDEKEEPEWDDEADLAMANEHQREVDMAREVAHEEAEMRNEDVRRDVYRESILKVFVEKYMNTN